MVQALMCVHSAGILHCDVKTGAQHLYWFGHFLFVQRCKHTCKWETASQWAICNSCNYLFWIYIRYFHTIADNWLLERCSDTEESCTTDYNYSSSSTINSNNNNSNADSYASSGTSSVGIRVKLIDFGRSLSVRQHSPHTASSSANKGTNTNNTSAQLATLTTLYQPVATDITTTNTATSFSTANSTVNGKPVVGLYQGDISAKGYKCSEMEQNLPWSYQVWYVICRHC